MTFHRRKYLDINAMSPMFCSLYLSALWLRWLCVLCLVRWPANSNYKLLFATKAECHSLLSLHGEHYCLLQWGRTQGRPLSQPGQLFLCRMSQGEYLEYQFHLWLDWNILHIKEGIFLPNYTCLTSIHTNINSSNKYFILLLEKGNECCLEILNTM